MQKEVDQSGGRNAYDRYINVYSLYFCRSQMGFKKGRNRDDICSNKLENYRFEIFNMVGSAIRNFYIYLFL